MERVGSEYEKKSHRTRRVRSVRRAKDNNGAILEADGRPIHWEEAKAGARDAFCGPCQ